ncbi:MAG: 50S ribosomal protein L4 [candidate division Zixibacteria bacterium]|nr:50S ribosomal protein L4 [candidate division Zixibacteria bacterium]
MSLTAAKFNADGSQGGSVTLPEALFGQTPNAAVLHAYVKMYNTNQRQGTVKTKTRAEVSGGGVKPWRQKGTGRARAGSNTSPVWVGGGRAFGPRPRTHREAMPRKMRRLALLSALSLKAQNGAVRIWDRAELAAPKTKSVVQPLSQMGVAGRKVLMLDEGVLPNFTKSCRNVPWLTRVRAELINPFEILKAQDLVISPEGLARMTEALAS